MHHKQSHIPSYIQYQLAYHNQHLTHSLTKHHTQNYTASVYQPRLKIKQRRYSQNHTFNHMPNRITKPTHKHTNFIHHLPKHTQKKACALPNLFNANKCTSIKYFITNKKKPTIKQYTGYHLINKFSLLKCGNIEPNPGPMPNLLQKYPTAHKRRQTTCFLPPHKLP